MLPLLAGPDWNSGRVAPAVRLLAEKLTAAEEFRDLAVPVSVRGKIRWWELAGTPRIDEAGAFAGFRGVASDVTQQHAAADRIARMARFDQLTGLPNRLCIHEALARALADAERLGGRAAFTMLDLDRFKAVNDTLGHPVGDRLLGRVSERLAGRVQGRDLIGRLGGDEFAVVIRDAADPARVEALLRWTHPEFGAVPPSRFVPLAADTRLIGPIGAWALRTACVEAAGWPDELAVAVNVSPEQLADPGFVATVVSALAASGLPPRRLLLEVSERVFAGDARGLVDALERAQALGVRLCLDDFGAGAAPLPTLARLRFAALKIDRQLMARATERVGEATAVVRAAIAVARSLGIVAVAEDVKTAGELHTARELGCTAIQGFFYGRPLPAAEARAIANRTPAEAQAA